MELTRANTPAIPATPVPARPRSRTPARRTACSLALVLAALALAGCSAHRYRAAVDRSAYRIIEDTQREALGRTNAFTVEIAANELRQRLLVDQNLPRGGPASLGSHYLDPIDHWPRDSYLESDHRLTANPNAATNPPVVLSLIDALQIAARNNRQYQRNKEDLFRAALDLDLERDEFRGTFAGLISGRYDQDRTGLAAPNGDVDESLAAPNGDVDESLGASTSFGVGQRLKSGAEFSLQLSWNLLQLLRPEWATSDSVFGDASVSIPLLRGAGRHIVAEPLTQAERNVVYAIYEFEDFKRSFAVQVADRYLSVLQNLNQVQNAEENYRGLIASTRRARRLLDAGNLPPIQVDQAIQNELSARNRWVSARENYAATLDSFKILLGLPTDAALTLDPEELKKLSDAVGSVLAGGVEIEYESEIPPADAPIVLEEPSNENAGPLELEPERAIRLALEHRLDLRIAQGRVYDAQRRIVIAADQLRADVSLFGSASLAADRVSDLTFNEGDYNALLNVDLPLERTSEAIAYRESYLNLEQSVGSLQELEDSIKLDVLDRLRILREARESLRIQALSVELAQRRVRSANLYLQAGRAEIRDFLEAQEDLLSAQNSLTAATVDYRVAELALQRDLGLLQVDSDGLWREFKPEKEKS